MEFIQNPVQVLSFSDVRVPLDVPRNQPRGVKWRGLSLKNRVIGSEEGLLNIVRLLKDVAAHTRHSLPVVMDENIHYRLLKWMYSRGMAMYAVRDSLLPLVCIYGVWHAYKFVCLHIHREFFSQFVFMDQGFLQDGDSVACAQRLPFIERSIATLWVVGMEFLPALDKEIDRIRSFLEGVQTRLGSSRRTKPVDGSDALAWLVDLCTWLNEKNRAITSRLNFLVHLRFLISDYCAAAFAIGFKVRECMWNGRRLHSSSHAKDVLMWSFVVLRSLSPKNAVPLRYLRTIAVTLSTWTTWNDVSPGVLYCEEACEALLSKLNRAMVKRPAMYTHEQYTAVFLSLPIAKNAHRLNVSVPLDVQHNFRMRLHDLINLHLNPPLCPWKPAGSVTHACTPLNHAKPGWIRPLLPDRKRARAHEATLKRCLCTLLQGKPPSPERQALFSQHFRQRTTEEAEQECRRIDDVLSNCTIAQPKKRRRLHRLDELDAS